MDDLTYYILREVLGAGSAELVIEYINGKGKSRTLDMPSEAKHLLTMLKHVRSENLLYHGKPGFEMAENQGLKHAAGPAKILMGLYQYFYNGQPDFHLLNLEPDENGWQNLEVRLVYYNDMKKSLIGIFPFKGERKDLMESVHHLQTMEGIKIGLN